METLLRIAFPHCSTSLFFFFFNSISLRVLCECLWTSDDGRYAVSNSVSLDNNVGAGRDLGLHYSWGLRFTRQADEAEMQNTCFFHP